MKTYTQSKVINNSRCCNFKSNGSSKASEMGVILHTFLEGGEIEKEGGIFGSYYRGKFSPFRFFKTEDEFQFLREETEDTKKRLPEFFTPNWNREKEYSIEDFIPTIGNVKLSAIVDLDDTGNGTHTVNVADWKSGQTVIDEYVPLSAFQAYLIAYIIFKKFDDVEIVNFEYVYIKKGDLRKKIEFFRSKLDLLKLIVFQVILSSENVGLKRNSYCQYCENVAVCPLANKDMYDISKGTLPEDYLELNRLKNIIEGRKGALKKEILKTEEGERYLSVINYHYVDLNDLTSSELLTTLNAIDLKELKITKLKADKLKKAGIYTTVKQSKSFKVRG